MSRQFLLDNKTVQWGEFADRLTRFRQMIQTDAAFAYIVSAPNLREQTETLCRDLDIEDYTYVLDPGEQPPAGLRSGDILAPAGEDPVG